MYSPKSKWEKEIKKLLKGYNFFYDVPVRIDMIFYMPRPKNHYRTGKFSHILKDDSPEYHSQRPDRDNLDKAVLDVMTDTGLLSDDCIVVDGRILKMWANKSSGVSIKIRKV